MFILGNNYTTRSGCEHSHNTQRAAGFCHSVSHLSPRQRYPMATLGPLNSSDVCLSSSGHHPSLLFPNRLGLNSSTKWRISSRFLPLLIVFGSSQRYARSICLRREQALIPDTDYLRCLPLDSLKASGVRCRNFCYFIQGEKAIGSL